MKKELYKYFETEAQDFDVSKQVFLQENYNILYMEDDQNVAVRAAVPVINASLGQVSKKYTLNGRQDIAFQIAGSYLLGSFKR